MPPIQSKIQTDDECLQDVNLFLTKLHNRAEQRQREQEEEEQDDTSRNNKNNNEEGDDAFFCSLGSRQKQNKNYRSTMNQLPKRIATLHQMGSLKIALDKIRDTTAAKTTNGTSGASRTRILSKFGGTSNRQLALYELGTAKIRQQRKSSSKSQHENGPMHIHSRILSVTQGPNTTIRRQRSLYILGAKKLLDRNRKEVTTGTNQQVPSSGHSDYYKRLHQRLHNLVAKMKNPISCYNSETSLSGVEIEDPPSCESGHHKTAFGIATKGIAGMFSTITHDFPGIRILSESSISYATLTKEQKTAFNVSKLCTKSQQLLLHQSSTKPPAIMKKVDKSFRCTGAQHDDDGDTTNMNALKLGLRGIAIQYLQDAINELQRIEMLDKFDLTLIGNGVNESVEDLTLLCDPNEDSKMVFTHQRRDPGSLKSLQISSSDTQSSIDCWPHCSTSDGYCGFDGTASYSFSNKSGSSSWDMLSYTQQHSVQEDLKDTEEGGREDVEEASRIKKITLTTAGTTKQDEEKMLKSSRHVVMLRRTTNNLGDVELCMVHH